MLSRICMILPLLFAMPVWSQVEPAATVPPNTDSDMQTPPPVSGQAYPTETGSESRSNYLSAGLNIQTAYNNNVEPAATAKPVSAVSYLIGSTFALDQSTPRTHRTFSYSPGFTLYEPTSALNALNQNATVGYEYSLSPHARISVQDSFVQASNVFDQPYGGVSGSTQSPVAAVVAPFANRLSNAASGGLSYQFSMNGMIGGSGTSSMMSYSNPAQAIGLPSSSNSRGGSVFYNLRLSSAQYIGMTYQYSDMLESLANAPSETRTHTLNLFYTLFLKDALSLSVSGGPQHFNVVQAPLPASASWTPAVTASVGWQRSQTNFAASYSRTVSGAGGLVGAFHATSANANGSWRLARTWTAGAAASYTTQINVLPAIFAAGQGGRSIQGTVSVQHPMGEHFTAGFGYARIHQSYSGVAVISDAPDSDREYISISYQFTRPLGR
jgi:hypothetical protein